MTSCNSHKRQPYQQVLHRSEQQESPGRSVQQRMQTSAQTTALDVPVLVGTQVSCGLLVSEVDNLLTDNFGRAASLHRNSIHTVSRFHGAFLVTNNHQLRLGAELVNQLQEASQVHVVECSLHLVEQIE